MTKKEGQSMVELADNLTLPAAALATQRTAFVGASGSGKSYGVGRIVEQLSAAGVPVIVLDTVGIWASLRLASDGKSPGLSFVVVGGDHADVPLSIDKGGELATFLHEHRASAVIDLSDWGERIAERAAFVSSFLDRLLVLIKKRRTTMTVIFDEAPDLIPEKARKGENEMKLSASGFVRRVRNYSCGTILVTQRPQDVAKGPFDQAGTMFVGALFGKHERAAMRDWVGRAARSTAVEGQQEALPSLEPGDFFFWSPAWKRYEKIRILPKWTWDGSSTNPIADDAVLSKLAPVDVGVLRELLEGMGQQAEAVGSKQPRRSSRQQAASSGSESKPAAYSLQPTASSPSEPRASIPEPSEDETLPWRQWVGRLRAELSIETARAESAVQRLNDVEAFLDRLAEMLAPVIVQLPRRPPKWAPSKITQQELEAMAAEKTPGLSAKKRIEPALPAALPPKVAPPMSPLEKAVETRLAIDRLRETAERGLGVRGRDVSVRLEEDGALADVSVSDEADSKSHGFERVLGALLWAGGTMDKVRLAILCGYQHSGGGFQTLLARMRAEGLLHGGRGDPMLTDRGRARGKGLPGPMHGQRLQRLWLGKLDVAARRIFAFMLAEARPLSLQEIADGAVDEHGKGYAVGGGGFHDGMRDLRRYALVGGARGKAIELGVAGGDFLRD